MTDQQQFGNAGEYIDKAKDYAQDNPDKTRSVIDKIEDAVDARTGGKHSGMVDKAGDWIEGRLGLPNNADEQPSQPTEPAPTEPAPSEPAPTEPAPTEPAPTEPAQPTEPAPTEPAGTPEFDAPEPKAETPKMPES
ncbi:antitoxin [Aestuariimicrobium ganziense]|uniref:antitoxin n=1 Tax=Aestuariimicrobium ganziense TaxID=2773677 RepID=UPI001941AF57|nr:antitoxin [Aestuariimicrobium ganziense]